jgi:hypothetical protein
VCRACGNGNNWAKFWRWYDRDPEPTLDELALDNIERHQGETAQDIKMIKNLLYAHEAMRVAGKTPPALPQGVVTTGIEGNWD